MKTKTKHNLISGCKDLGAIESIKPGESMDWTIVHDYESYSEKENVELISNSDGFTVKCECFGDNEQKPYFTGVETYSHVNIAIGALRMLIWI